MRILLAVHGFPPTHSAGAERLAERIGQWLLANHHDVQIFAVESLNDANYRVESSIQDGIRVHRLFYDPNRNDDKFANSYNDPLVGEAFSRVLSSDSFDLVHLISGYLLGGQIIPVAKQRNIPVVLTLTEYWFLCPRLNLIHPSQGLCVGPESDHKCARCLLEDKRRYRYPAQKAAQLADAIWPFAKQLPFAVKKEEDIRKRRLTLQQALNSADVVICPSQFLIDKFADFGFNTSRYRLIRHGLAFTPSHSPAVDRPASGELRLGFIGQLKRHKGVDLLIDAVIPLLDAGYCLTLDLWGPEHEEPQYNQELKKRAVRYPMIRWNGRYTGAKVWDILAGFDALVIPSRWYENSPIVINEAYQMGVPVIATRLGGMAEMVEHEKNGLLFELNNVRDLGRQIERLLTEPGLLERLRSGIAPVRTIDGEMSEILAEYQRLVNSS